MNQNFYQDILLILELARQRTYAAIHTQMVQAYWLMGKRIVEEEQQGQHKAAYGDGLLKNLSIALSKDLGKGFSYANLRNFRHFFLTYPDAENCYALRSKLSWTHHRLIMRVENPTARDFYLKECEEQNWSSRTLERNINTFYYQRLLSSKNPQALTSNDKIQVQDFIKDPYIFEFLNIPEGTIT